MLSSTLPIHQRRAVQIIVVVCVLLSINWVFAIARFLPNVMYMDQWDFFLPLFQGEGWWARFLQQHGPHRQGLAFVITGWILDATRWDVRVDSLWIASVLVVATVLALRLKWKMTGSIGLRDAWIPLMGLSLVQFETVLLTPNASHSVFPLALILLTANIWLSPSPVMRFMGAAAAGVLLTVTGFGVLAAAVMTLLIAASVLRQWHVRESVVVGPALAALMVIASGWVLLFGGYAFQPGVAGFRFPWTPATDYLRFVVLMLNLPAGEIGDRTPHYLLGTALALVLVAAAAYITWVWKRRPTPGSDVMMMLMGSGLLFVVATAIGRVSLGVLAGTASRYLTLMFPMWLAVYFAAETSQRRLVSVAASLCVWALALAPYVDTFRRPLQEWPGTAGMIGGYVELVEKAAASKAAWADAYLATGSWEAAQAATPQPLYPNPRASGFDEKLRYMREHKLSFFAGDPSRGDYLPWLSDGRR